MGQPFEISSPLALLLSHILLPVLHCPWESVFLPLGAEEHPAVRILSIQLLSWPLFLTTKVHLSLRFIAAGAALCHVNYYFQNNEILTRSTSVSLGRFKSTFIPLFDIYTFNQKPKGYQQFSEKGKCGEGYAEVGNKKRYKRIYQITKTCDDQ